MNDGSMMDRMEGNDGSMMDMMGGMGTMMIIGLVLLAVLIGIAVYLAVRAGNARGRVEPTAREVLQRRLASGEISSEEYFERESALRDAQPGPKR